MITEVTNRFPIKPETAEAMTEAGPGLGAAYQEHIACTFKNGYGASIVRGAYTYGGYQGLWELAVLKDGHLDYSHPVAEGDVRGHLTAPEVGALLDQIAATVIKAPVS